MTDTLECSPYIARVSRRLQNQDDAWLDAFDRIFDAFYSAGMEAGEAAMKAADKADEEIAEGLHHQADMHNEDRRIA
jgi:hypothetical protein